MTTRDKQGGKKYFIDNAFLKTWGAKLGPHCIAVYNVLAMHADSESQTAYPSFQTIADYTGMSRRQVVREIEKLKANNIIRVEERTEIHPETGKPYFLSNIFMLLHPDEWFKVEDKSLCESSDTQSPGVMTGSHQASDSESLPLVTQSHLNNTQLNNTQLTNISPNGEVTDIILPLENKPEPEKPIPKIEYTPFLRDFLAYFNAKRFKNPTQVKTVTDLEAAYGEKELFSLAEWAANKGMGLGQAIPAIKSALTKKVRNGVNQNGHYPNKPTADSAISPERAAKLARLTR